MASRINLNDNQSPSNIQISPTLANFIAGTIGGIAGVVTGHPFDTIKVCVCVCVCVCVHHVHQVNTYLIIFINQQVRLQSQSAERPIYRGTVHCATTIVNQEGVSFVL
jgi:solute carrier family 25 carnitine/acylcarnitine transporter 20/29